MERLVPFRNAIKEKLAKGEDVIGTFMLNSASCYVEILGYAGFDFVIIDTEHAASTGTDVVDMIRACEVSGAAPIVRVKENDASQILQALDSGAAGVLVPQVNTKEEAIAVVMGSKYAPLGNRGVAGVARGARYGHVPFGDYVKLANDNTMVITQIEHISAVGNWDKFLTVEGLDGMFIGQYDLSQSMGLTGQFRHPDYISTIETLVNRVRATGRWIGMFCMNAEDAAFWKKRGVQFLAIGADTIMMAAAAKELIGSFRSLSRQ